MTQGAGGWPQDVVDALRNFGQGDIIGGVRFPYYGALTGGLPLTYPPAEGEEVAGDEERLITFVEYESESLDGEALAVITSQTCDVCEEGTPLQPWIQVSPLCRLSDDLRGETLPDFLYRVTPPDLRPGVWVIDLRIEVPIEKTVLVGKTTRSAFRTEDELIAFADALGLRRSRAALASSLTDTVGHTLRQRRRTKKSFKTALRNEVYRVMLNIDEGSRSVPRSVRLHVITNEAPSEKVRNVFDDWWDEANAICASEGITLHPNAYHPRTQTDVGDYDRWIKLNLG